MISFLPTEEEASFIKVAKELAEAKIRPLARQCEKNRQVSDELVNEMKDLGFLSLELPESWEGMELPLISQVQVLQALSYGDLSVVQGLPGSGDAAPLIRQLSENSLLKQYKDELMNSNKTIAFLNLIDQWGNRATVRNTGSCYVLEGTSLPVRLAGIADYAIITAIDTDGECVLLWLKNQSGSMWSIEEGDVRLGLLASKIGRFIFKEASVEKSQVLAKGEQALELIKQVQMRNYILQAAKEIGLMEAALDYATRYTAERKAFGQEIAKFQGVSFRIADMAMETRVANHLVWQAALKVDKNDKGTEGYALRALYRAHRSLRFVTDSAVQLLGGHGYVQEFPVEKWMRDGQAQVALYGRERDYLLQRGQQIIAEEKEVTIV